MKFITWNNSFSVHVEEIDAQHQWLTDIINALYDEMNENKGKRVLEIVVESLLQYTRLHFETEQKQIFMQSYKRPDMHLNKSLSRLHNPFRCVTEMRLYLFTSVNILGIDGV